MVKKTVLFLVLTIIFACLPMETRAQEIQHRNMEEYMINDNKILVSGYTEEGVFYEVHGEEVIAFYSTSVTVERTIVYYGNVSPQRTIDWTEEIDGVTYSGTLFLKKIYSTSGKTTATYQGTLYRK